MSIFKTLWLKRLTFLLYVTFRPLLRITDYVHAGL